jgi:uncharacterized membrane protein
VNVKQSDFSAARLNSLSDGVFAIAMTLLVLDLKLPPLGLSADGRVFTAALVEQIPGFISWILSFAILCRLWITHHALLSTGKTRSRRFMTWNLVFLGAIAIIPFPASLLSEHHDQALSVFIFSATYAIAGLALAGMAAAYRRQLETAGASSEGTPAARDVIIILATALISCLLALFHPWLGALMWVVYPFASMLAVRARAPDNSPAGNGG